MHQTKLIVGNWKMNGLSDSLAQAKAMGEGLAARSSSGASQQVKVVICPPATLLAQAYHALRGTDVGLGGQDCHTALSGAHTGDISASMLADAGATYVIVGHSERRANHFETDLIVSAKASAAIQSGLMPIICVGESEAQRDAGQAEAIVLDQLLNSIPSEATTNQICIAYEPVWAIGTGRTPSGDDVAAMHASIRAALETRFGHTDAQTIAILYGGSVSPKNATELLGIGNVNGALVGGASLTAESFLAIIDSQL